MHRSRMAFALGLVGPLLVLGGCSGNDPQPKIAPPESAAPTSDSPSQSGPVAPTLPAAAKRHDAAGAEAFVSYYLDVVNFSQSTGQLGPLRRLGDPNCGACSEGIKFLKQTFTSGGRIRGGAASLTSANSRLLNTGDFQVRGDLVSERQVVDFAGKRDDKVFPGGTVQVQFIVSRRDSDWVVAFWDRTPS